MGEGSLRGGGCLGWCDAEGSEGSEAGLANRDERALALFLTHDWPKASAALVAYFRPRPA